jgi:putative flippase GtrA
MTPATTTDVAAALASPSSVAPPPLPDAPPRGPRLLRELAAFGVVGLLAFLVDLGTFNAARQLLDLGPLSAKTASVVLATTVAFAGNREWTFRDRGRAPAGHQYVLFFLLNGVGLLIALACLGVTYYVLGLRGPLAENLSANGVGLVLGTAFRFWAYRRWVFRPAR